MAKSAITPDVIADTLHSANAIADDEIVTHAVVIVATTRYRDDGTRYTQVHSFAPTGEMDRFVERGLLHTRLTHLNGRNGDF